MLLPLPRSTKEDVLFFEELIEAGKYQAVIDRCLPLGDMADANRFIETEQKTGTVAPTVSGGRAR